MGRWLRAGALCGVVDLLWAALLAEVYGGSLSRVFQGVSAVALGPEVVQAGALAMAAGLIVHFGVAFGWSAVFLTAFVTSPRLRHLLAARAGLLAVAAVYGPLIWIAMSAAVIPARTGRPPTFDGRWWVQLVGHALFVGLPIVWAIGREPDAR
jgi:hypothetical protein